MSMLVELGAQHPLLKEERIKTFHNALMAIVPKDWHPKI